MQTRGGSRRQAPAPSSPSSASTDPSAEGDGSSSADSEPAIIHQVDGAEDAAKSSTNDFIPMPLDSPQDIQMMDSDEHGIDKKRKRPKSHDENGESDQRSSSSLENPKASDPPKSSTGDARLDSGPAKRVKMDTAVQISTLAQSQAFRGQDGTLPSDRSQLPKPIWQRAISFLPPQDLARLLRVNKTFQSLLIGPRVDTETLREIESEASLVYLEPDLIWRTSRRLYYPNMPKPLESLSELENWKLVYGKNCQFCTRVPAESPTDGILDPLKAGPGPTGVRIIWPFAIRSCSQCLMSRTERVCRWSAVHNRRLLIVIRI
jgi:hypothetical protein